MEKSNRDNIVLLFDYFNLGSRDLLTSFLNAGYQVKAVCINDEGFLPDNVENVFEYFLGSAFKNVKPSKPLYFNQIKVPKYWEISGNNSNGTICDKAKVRGRIFYTEPKNKRLVKVVDWLDEDGVVKASDHYNKYGICYGRTIFNKFGKKVSKSYFDSKGKEIIVENFVTGDITLNYQGITKIFKNRTEFVIYYMKLNGFENKAIYFNSLSIPFFVSNALPDNENRKCDILFWQEEIVKEIPGNMQLILDGKAPRCKRIMVQNNPSYEKLSKVKGVENIISKLGFIYPFERKNLGRKEALICTNTQEVEKLKEILEALPEVKFHVAALTEMSAKLLAHEKYDNAILYPNIKMSTLNSLFVRCDFYLDINHEGEIVDATRRAFIQNQLILAFNETSHGGTYTALCNRFSSKDYSKLVHRIKEVLTDKEELKKALETQQEWALTAKSDDYDFN
ncbi:accessory Sec system glycosylation chaperone GtfB [Pseudobutyrivibrio sp.]|uniref:accessory Sec system glycosylation chaperone GtfB n=1 Tax=Pseudobutyrivibrio sp. TaxID=2014367 RepID=UPI001B5D3F2F|nr:accessory Sec system glycosylation chaperone GtfB [Pseudobutyrivibrio sp.]MBP3263563.1 accessory Sec system glycosylation chaperone GtfB [Pseudobutyrivibrio sp.]